MYNGLLFLIVICSVTRFNNQISPVKHFTKDDPLFGQTVIQSKDGVFVPSPTNGKYFSCTPEDECVKVNFNDEKPKGPRPASVVSSLISEEERLVMCNQVCIKESVTEDLNGNCQLMNPIGKGKLNPAKLVLNQMEKKPTSSSNNNNNNNNNYRGGRIDQGKWRMRRDTHPDSETKTAEDDDNAGAEIAFVLDGSGSITQDDFQRAKDFIYKVMLIVWKACFNCNFAIVQYGSSIRTELSLLENKDRVRMLQKVKKIQQIFSLTKTASAIHHVLTNVFIPENGSKNNSKKIIIVLSDGKILGDTMNLTDVLNMPQMKDVIRYSIGVGEDFLSKPEAIKELEDIADPDKYFSVSSYAGLNDILSSLEQNLIWIIDAGAEIAFVLDGSDSIQPDDFQRAKDFIYNFMLNVWKACFNFNFAIVQYGSSIRTELSLLENKDRARTLQKVKEIQQIFSLTNTASAIHHVLTNIFIPENGSKKNSKKIIIVLSDGKILGDPMNLTDVLNMPQMKDVTRYSIGVGEGILSNPEAIKEMKEIADPDQFFSVSNYTGLDDILSSLKSIIEIKDIDVSGQAKCAHSCANVPGSFRCVCNLGFELDTDDNQRYRPSDFNDVELKIENFCIKQNVT
ncbi:hypothetical protein ABG768_007257 [Culter alburnus]|uniref:VWFA domain-containing protein n=1 Tax=Culter alburnus TaxID=194366 RepID=A0AAW1ZLM5_CULAL